MSDTVVIKEDKVEVVSVGVQGPAVLATGIQWGGIEGDLEDQSDLALRLGAIEETISTGVQTVFGENGPIVDGVDYIKFNTDAVQGSPEVGQMFWDDDSGTPSVRLRNGVTLQIGQEHHVKSINLTGQTIANGTVVYISGGAIAGSPGISPAIASDEQSSDSVIGVATETIIDGATGKVTVFGFVNDVDTSAFNVDDVLWLSPSSAGGMTTVRPTHPDHAVKIGFCITSHPTQGRVLIHTQKYANANDILLPMVGTPEDNLDVLDWFRHSWSTGLVDGGDITPNIPAGTIDIAPNDFITRQGIFEDSPLVVYRDPGVVGLSIPDNEVSYIYRDYNNGIPIWDSSTSIEGFNGIDKVITYAIGRNGSRMNIVDLRKLNVDSQRKSRRRDVEFDGYVFRGFWRSSSARSTLSASGLNPIVGNGRYYFFNNLISHTPFDTTVAGTANANTFTYFYNRTGIWSQVPDSKTIGNNQYDLNGTLTAMDNNKWRSDWVYVVLCGTLPYLAIIRGDAQYTSQAAAQTDPTPAILPPQIEGIAVLVGQIIIEKGAASMSVFNAGSALFSAGIPAVSINDITGVSIISPQVDDTLRYNGTAWVNVPDSVPAAGNGYGDAIIDSTLVGPVSSIDIPIQTGLYIFALDSRHVAPPTIDLSFSKDDGASWGQFSDFAYSKSLDGGANTYVVDPSTSIELTFTTTKNNVHGTLMVNVRTSSATIDWDGVGRSETPNTMASWKVKAISNTATGYNKMRIAFTFGDAQAGSSIKGWKVA